ncbi:MAG: hypothetical protein IJI66_02875 [Erysipelotrichaceae bacterium]|nr:hypothetical protein [Erysipelotrichaceae bacterium]
MKVLNLIKQKKYLILVLAVILFSGYLFLQPSLHFTQDKPILEKGQTYKADDFIKEVKGDIVYEFGDLDTSKVGEYEYHFLVKKWFFQKDFVLKYSVVDTTPPTIEILNKNLIIDPEQGNEDKDILGNIRIDEGYFVYVSDYDKEFPGIYTVDVKASDEYDNESAASFNVIVKDTTAPMILDSGYGTMILKGEDFNIHDVISYGDNADPQVKLSVEGEVNTKKVGTYPLNIKLEDEAGNITQWDLDVKVVSRYPKQEEEEEYEYLFEDFVNEYQAEGLSFGIDVSTWQGEVDYEAAKKAGCEFVIIRIGYSHNGKFKEDDEFKRNIEMTKKAGLKTGVYLFSYDKSEEELLATLDQVFELLGDYELELPLIFDWEDFFDYQEYEMSFKELNHLYDVFCEVVEAKGYKAMLYGSKYYLNNIWAHKDTRNVWLAQYSDWPSYEYPYRIWQVTDHGRIAGIDGYVDLNILFEESE